jgi:hypothetical protein
MADMAERPSGGIEREEAGDDPEGAAQGAAEPVPVTDDESDATPEESTAEGWSASTPEVQEWAAASDRAFGYDPAGDDGRADEAP